MEKIVYFQIVEFLQNNDIFEKFQSGFRASHSTKIALLKIVIDLRLNTDGDKASRPIVLLDLSTAFDTVEHHIFLQHLEAPVKS